MSVIYNRQKLPVEVQYSSGYTLYYGYNARKQRVFLADNNSYNVSYSYDPQSRLHEVRKSSDGSLIARFEYSNDQLVQKTLGNGAYTVFTYDSNGKLVKQSNYYPNATLSSSNRYEYDTKGFVMKMTDKDNHIWRYTYDTLGQLVGWTSSEGDNIQYTYDDRGNRVLLQRGSSNEQYSVNEMNQYMSYNGNEQFTYDANGNLIRRVAPNAMEQYRFDAEGKLISTETLNNRFGLFPVS